MTTLIYEFENCRLDAASRELLRDGKPVSIEPRALDLLLYMIENRDRALGKDELQDGVWGTIVTDAALTRCVMKLRKAIESNPAEPILIKTVPRFGYRFTGSLITPGTSSSRANADITGPERHSIIVLPLANLSGDPENEYFSDGIAEEILNLLAKIPNLRVASRTSSFSYKESNTDLKTVARELNADIVLEGSVRRADNRVRITMQLIDALEDDHLWSEIYDRELTDIFAVQAEIANQVVTALTSGEAGPIQPFTQTDSPQAYDYFLRGRQYYHQWDRGGWDYAIEMFERALELDPKYARAWAGLADCMSSKYMWNDSSPRFLERADECSAKALQLDPASPEAHSSRGFALTLLQNFETAAEAFEKAISIDPMLYEAWYLFGPVENRRGRSS